MGDISFGSTVGMLEHAIAGAGASHAAIANNIANVNTPNFHRTDVSFKEALAAADPQPNASDELQLATTDGRHFGGPSTAASEPFAPTVVVDDTTKMRVDGSNVDVDQEMAKLSSNSGYAQTMSQLLSTQFTRIRAAAQDHF